VREYLPIGTVVILQDGEKSIMIYGRKQIHAETNKLYDYVACLYPEGNMSEEFTYLFNHNQIQEVLFAGYANDDETEFVKFLNDLENHDNGQ